MAGFFSLGGGGGGGGGGRGSNNSPPHNNNNNNNNEDEHDTHPSSADISINPHSQGLFWAPYKNDQPTHNPYKPSSSSSFELWQTQDHHHHHHQQQFNLYQHHHRQQQQDLYTSAAALGVGPTVNPILDAGGSEHHLHPHQARAATSGSGSGGVSCQDCGNQAKKDCVHMRCRTCCKSRGFDCATHIKSTWVPAAKRRERQQLQQPGHHHHHLHHHDHDSDDHNNNNNQQILQISSKRHRDSASSLLPNTLTPRLPSSSGLEVGNFPAEVSSNAVFRCVRVSSVDSADEQYAYQTAVSIGGHLFKGILLDHGPETTTTTNYSTSTIGGGGGGETSSGGVGGGGGGISQPLDLIATSAATTAAGHQVPQYVDPSALYQVAQPINAYAIAGTQFFLPPRS